MSDFGFPAIITVAMFGIITMAYNNLEYKGYPSISSCTGECYEEYLKEHGNILEQLEQKKQEAATDPYFAIRGLWGGCAACHGQNGEGMGMFPKLSGQSAEYISEALYEYKNRVERGNMSQTMWAQASLLSDNDIELLSKFIEETLE